MHCALCVPVSMGWGSRQRGTGLPLDLAPCPLVPPAPAPLPGDHNIDITQPCIVNTGYSMLTGLENSFRLYGLMLR